MEQAKKVNIPIERKKGEVWAFMSLKFHDGDEDKQKVEELTKALESAGIKNVVMARDVEKWGQAEIPEGKRLMPDFAFPAMEKCDMLICEFSEKGVGLGIGAAYAFAKDKPVYVIARTGSDISTTMSNIAKEVIFYNQPRDLVKPFQRIVKQFPRVILASKSPIRKQMMVNADIPFEVIVSNADETPDDKKSFRSQLSEIAMRKAKTVFEGTIDEGMRLIVAADQNIVFDGKMYGKPKSIDEARKLIKSMAGSDQVFAYTGNAILLADGREILESVNVTDIARMSVDQMSEKVLEEYLEKGEPLTKCGGISVADTPFVHLKEGRSSTACGMTIEFMQELYKAL